MPWIRQFSRIFLEETGRLERVYFTAPFSAAVNIRGYENLVLDIYERPRFVHRLLAFLCDEVIAPFLEVMRSELGKPDLIMDGRDAWASPPMISLDMMDEYVVAYTERLRDRLGDKVITRGNWGDAKIGDVEGFFSRKLRCSPGSLSVLDPDLHEVGPERVKAFADKHNASIAAGVDATLLQQGPVEAIVERIKLYIDKMARDSRCMLHLNQIPADTPPEHIHAAVAACHTYGRHPIPDNLEDIHFEMDIFQIIGDGMPAIGVAGCHRRMNMLRRGISRNLIEMKHATAISCHLIDIQFDPFHNGFNRPLLKQGGVDARGYRGVMFVGKRFDSLRSDFVQIRVQHTQGAGTAAKFSRKKTLNISYFGVPPVSSRDHLVAQSIPQPLGVCDNIFIHHIK